MSGSLAAVDRLRVALASPLASIGKAVRDARVAHIALHEAEDIMETLGATANLAIACEALQKASKVAEASLRSTLASVMLDIGAPSIRTEGHTVSVSKGRRSVIVTDQAAIPKHLFSTPEPTPDKKAIAALLKAKETVPGCALSNGGAPILTIRKSED